MSIQYFGKVAITGITGDMNYVGYGHAADTTVAVTSNIPTSLGFTDEVDQVALMNKSSEVVGVALRNRRKQISIEFTPVSTDGTQTIANAKLMQTLPKIGSKVTLSGFPGTSGDEMSLNGDWNYWGGGTISHTQEGHVRMNMTVMRYAAGAFDEVTS